MFIKQLDIDAYDGSERCYLTTERDFYLLYKVYVCIATCLNINTNDKFSDIMKYFATSGDNNYDRFIPTVYDYYPDNIPIVPLTELLYDKHHIKNIMEGNIEENKLIVYLDTHMLRENTGMFVYDLPPLLVILGLFFRRLVGPKYINRWDIKCAQDIIF
jgi:hypothetical protein